MQQNKQLNPQPKFADFLSRILKRASQQKMLPNIVYNASKQFGNRNMLDYQKLIKKQYEKQLKYPVKYNPQDAKSARQKFREKVLKLMSNELQIDYFQHIKNKNGRLVTFRGFPVEERHIQTKKQYAMFQHFNESKFKNTYSNIFDDRLQLGMDQLYPIKAKSKRCHTLNLPEPTSPLQAPIVLVPSTKNHIITAPSDRPQKRPLHHHTQTKLINFTRKKPPMIYFNDNVVVGRQVQVENEELVVLDIMKHIGKFSWSTKKDNIFLMKESFCKFFKYLYEKPHRIIDFLQIKEVMNFQDFWNISRKLRVMPNDHLLFLTFMFYDSNNDGYIDDYDIDKVCVLGETRPALYYDYKKLKKFGFKKHLTHKPEYLDLYKRSQVTETIYFQWSKGAKRGTVASSHQHQVIKDLELEMKNKILSSHQKHVFLDFQAFCSIYKHQKPFLWYDLMKVLSDLTFHGFRYQ